MKNHFCSILLFISLIVLFINCKTNKDSNCKIKERVFGELFLDENVNKYLHQEIKERTPYFIVFENNNCNIENDKFIILDNSNNKEYYLKVTKYEVEKDTINVGLYYNLEGVDISCTFLRKDDTIILVDSKFIEF